MESFLRLYGFCRNISFVAFVVALIFLFYPSASFGLPANSPVPALAALLISLVMFHRYLKFLRLYSFEVFRLMRSLHLLRAADLRAAEVCQKTRERRSSGVISGNAA